MAIDDIAITVHDECCRRALNVVSIRHLFAEVVSQVQTDDFYSTLQILLNPIHDGLGRKARQSRIAEKLHYDRLTSADSGVQRCARLELRSPVAQQKPDANHGNDHKHGNIDDRDFRP